MKRTTFLLFKLGRSPFLSREFDLLEQVFVVAFFGMVQNPGKLD